MTNVLRKHWLSRALVILVCLVTDLGHAHPADESGMRVRPEPHKLEIRLTFNILTLTRLVKVDTDGNGLIGISELDAAQAEIAFYLNRHIGLQINQKDADLGADVAFEYLWPDARSTPPMSEPEYASRNVDVTFVQAIEGRLLEDFWLSFDIFEQTGPMQVIRAVYEKDGQNTEVQFTAQDPEYRYDTYYAEDPFVQEAEKKRKEEAARIAAEKIAAEKIAAEKRAAAKVAGAEAAKGPSNERWWMVRVFVLILIIVLSRHAALARRAKRLPTRRTRRS